MNKVALICLVAIFATLVGQAAAQDYHQITWHNSNLMDCQILDENNYYAAGWSSTTVFSFLMSTNAGQTWQMTEVDHTEQPFCTRGLWMINSQEGWICADNFGLYKTSNSGANWINMSNQPGVRNNSNHLRKIRFISPQVGYLMSTGDLKKTTDSGNTWTTIKANQAENGEGGFRDFDVDQSGSTIVISAGRYNSDEVSNCWVSQNGGESWQLSFVNSQHFSFHLKVASELVFYAAIADENKLFRSIDGGLNWQLFLPAPAGGTVADLAWANNRLYAVSNNNDIQGIWRISSGSWEQVTNLGNIVIYSLSFQGNHGMTVGDDGSIATFTDTTVATDDPVTPATPDPELTCYPNPFRGSTNVKFNQIDNSPTTIAIYNTRGQLVRTLVNSQKLSLGEHSFTWDGKTNSGQPVAAGVYFYKMLSGRFSSTRKMIMMK